MNLHTRIVVLTLLATGSSLGAQRGAPNEGTAQPGPRLKIERNLEYARAGGQALTLDLYRQDPTPRPSPVIVWIHGSEPGAAGAVQTWPKLSGWISMSTPSRSSVMA